VINYGNALLEMGRYAEAETAFRRAADAAPASPLGSYGLGLVAERRKDLERAIAFFRRSVEIDSKFQRSHFNLAAAYANLRKYSEAVVALKTLLRLSPNDREARAMLRQIEREEAKQRE
jgi:tetratricopeptide (TPR) repeat protein